MLLSLVLMVKNEEKSVIKTLDSVVEILDKVTVLDTGSTDNTIAVVKEWIKNRNLRGKVYEAPFVDYAESRNAALAYDAEDPATFSLMLSADETLTPQSCGNLYQFLKEHKDSTDGAYCVEMRTVNRSWPYPRVIRTSSGWRYIGAIHERPVGPNGEVTPPIIPGVTVTHFEMDPDRKLKRLREVDLPMLTRMVEDESVSIQERAHAIFFLAETHAVLAGKCDRNPGSSWLTHQMTAMSLYFRYAQIAEQPNAPAADHDKAMYALFLYFHLADQANIYSSEEFVPRLELLTREAPTMPGAHFLLAQHAAQLDVRHGLKYAEDAAEVAKKMRENPIYEVTDDRFEWLSLLVAAQCAKQLKLDKKAHDLAERALLVGGPRDKFEEYL